MLRRDPMPRSAAAACPEGERPEPLHQPSALGRAVASGAVLHLACVSLIRLARRRPLPGRFL